MCKAVDLGEELIRLGHAVSCQDEGSELRGDHDESRSLQKLLVRNIKWHVSLEIGDFYFFFLLFHVFLAPNIKLMMSCCLSTG